MSQLPPRIAFAGICKSYGGVRALDQVSFSVAAGCIHAIVGENGAGKSTLMKILSGAVRPDAGTIEIDGRFSEIREVRHAQGLGVSMVYQEFNLAPHLSVSENVYLGRWPRGRFGLVRFGLMHQQTDSLVRELGLNLSAAARVEALSVAQQQMVEIAKALSLDARILILDEPSAVLTPHELRILFDVVRRMRDRGLSILYISHRLDEIFELADCVTVLRDGRHISTRPISETRRDRLIAETVGRSLQEEFPARATTPGNVVLEVRGLSVDRRFADVTFAVRAGEVFALTGMVGSGRSSVAHAIFGALRGLLGEIRLGNLAGPFASPRLAQRAGIALVPEDRKRQGLLLARAVRENLSLANLHNHATLGFMHLARERVGARDQISALGIRAAGVDAPAGTLSGGNQQKVLLARWLDRPCPLMILDEPTRGVDVGAKVEIYQIINTLCARGTAVLMISSELPEVIGMADRIGVMCRGRLAGIVDNQRRDAAQEALLRLAVGEKSE